MLQPDSYDFDFVTRMATVKLKVRSHERGTGEEKIPGSRSLNWRRIILCIVSSAGIDSRERSSFFI